MEQAKIESNERKNNLDYINQSKKSYGGFVNIKKYLFERYHSIPQLSDKGKALVIERSTMEKISGRKTNNCSLVSVARVINYYGQKRGLTQITDDIYKIYGVIEKISKNYGYNDIKGTFPTKINDIMRDGFAAYGYKSKCKGVYTWDINTVKNEINKERPLLMSLLRGFYRDHTITVSGYSIWRAGEEYYPILRVVDGWQPGYHYIDFRAFEEDLRNAGIGSFNTCEVNKEDRF